MMAHPNLADMAVVYDVSKHPFPSASLFLLNLHRQERALRPMYLVIYKPSEVRISFPTSTRP